MITATGWTRLGARCFTRRYESFDLTVTAVVGDEAVLVVDSRASLPEGRELLADVRALSDLPLRAVVNTHAHYDHTFGNAAFEGVPVVGHESLLQSLPDHAAQTKAWCLRKAAESPRYAAMAQTPVRVPDITFASAWATDLGGCYVEVVYPGRGHTDGDVVVTVPEDRVVVVGDLLEQSGPPSFDESSWPLEWPGTLDLVAGLTPEDGILVPGHGEPVGRDFLEEQHHQIVGVAEQVNELALAGVSLDDAYERGTWPFPRETVEPALARAFAQWTPPSR